MRYGFKNGAEEALRLAANYAREHGLHELNCVDAQIHQPSGGFVEKGIIGWTVRFDGLPRGSVDDGSIILAIDLETGEVKQLGRPRIT